MDDLSPETRSFAEGAADIAAARALAGTPEADLLALVRVLATEQRRSHLEALAEASLGKAVKKAARTAAYKLKSAGVEGEVRRAASIAITAEVSLERVAIVGAPGLDGHIWLVVADLPGAPGIELNIKGDGEAAVAHALEELSRAQLRRYLESAGSPRPILAHADLAVRLIDRLAERLPGLTGGVPPAFENLTAWRDVAVAHGADPARVDARALVGDPGALDEAVMGDLLEDPRVAFLVPPMRIGDFIERRIGELMHSDEPIEEADFVAQAEAILDEAADTLFAEEGMQERMASWLEDDADMLLAVGARERARAALALADACRAHQGTGREWPPLARIMRDVLNIRSAWQHRKAHIDGHAHH